MNTDELLESVCNDIELITGIKTVIYDENQNILHRQPNMMCDFCKEVRRSPALTAKCRACDAYGFSKSVQARDICVYHCHMGLTEAVAPVFENGRTVGYLMLGQLLRKGEREQVKERILSLGNEVNSEALCRFLDAMPETDEQHLRATARILAMSAAYVRTNELLARHKETAAYKIEKHVFLHVADPALSASTVCAALGFSRTALYNACKSSFGMGIREYIQKARGEHAIHLLQKTHMPLTHVAEQVGMNGTARLNRLLQAQVGLSAKEIRRHANEKPQDLTFS